MEQDSGYAIVSASEARQVPYPYVYVNTDGTVQELHPNQRQYLETEFAPGDGGAPSIKTSYLQRNGWGELKGFLARSQVPRGTQIKEAPAEDPSRPMNRSESIEWLRSKGMEVIENSDGSFTSSNPRR